VEKQIEDYLNSCVAQYDVVIVNDFGHGFITQGMIDILADKARFLGVNVQTNSANAGFNLITKYPRADYICLDEVEARLACHDRLGALQQVIARLATSSGCSKVAVTKGHQGSLVYDRERGFFEIPVFSLEVKDRIGAGDAYFSITSPGVAAGFPMELVGFIGNAVGALAVRIVGNRTPVEPIPLFKFVTALLK
jgi:sugar/nucleoside kinase (ribokinase family)